MDKPIAVHGETNKDAAWFYPETSMATKSIENHVPFSKGVKITE